MEHPKDVGDRTTLAVMIALRDAGYEISMPFGENTRYDLIADNGEWLLRVQCKTGRLRDGAVRFMTSSSYAHHASSKERSRCYLGQIDDFGVYCPETAGVYLVPIDQVRTSNRAMRGSSRRGTASGSESGSRATTRSGQSRSRA